MKRIIYDTPWSGMRLTKEKCSSKHLVTCSITFQPDNEEKLREWKDVLNSFLNLWRLGISGSEGKHFNSSSWILFKSAFPITSGKCFTESTIIGALIMVRKRKRKNPIKCLKQCHSYEVRKCKKYLTLRKVELLPMNQWHTRIRM